MPAYVLVSILGGYLAVKKVVQLGDIQAFIQYMRSFTQPIGQLAAISNTLQSTAAAAERVFEFLDEDEEVPDTASPIPVGNIQGQVTFRDVQFAIPKTNKSSSISRLTSKPASVWRSSGRRRRQDNHRQAAVHK